MYLQMASIIGEKIRSRVFPAGTKLPPERELASLFGVSRTTAINAYRCLEQQGLVVTKVGSGTYVAALPAGAEEEGGAMPWGQLLTPFPRLLLSTVLREILEVDFSGGSISLAAGMPDPGLYPVELVQRIMAGSDKSLNQVDLGHIPTEGYGPLRRLVARMLAEREIE
jgi:DNA-binding transcriptional MocR family regulator